MRKYNCIGNNKKTGNPCSRKVLKENEWCYQHKKITPPVITDHNFVGGKPVIVMVDDTPPVSDDVSKNHVFFTNQPVHIPTSTWDRVKTFFKRSKDDQSAS